MEVSNDLEVPSGMDEVVIPPGLYALFLYKGPSSDRAVFQYIFNTWLPGSGYELDDRPHYEILGEKYRNNDPESEEEIWIPIREMNQ
ncbi:GyrI-like small molecule binding domain-containing protein [Muriicola jejuensis]|nr:GyrI-like small molecule binding domain-containing protein [Muriicola jejuensis]